jgi:hypothetical protein
MNFEGKWWRDSFRLLTDSEDPSRKLKKIIFNVEDTCCIGDELQAYALSLQKPWCTIEFKGNKRASRTKARCEK